jgi:hypothetical protein
MSAYAESQVPQDRLPRASGPALINELHAAHSVLRERIKELGELTERAAASRLECTSARLRLSQASIERRAVLKRIWESLSGRADSAGSAVLTRVRAADGELIAHSIKHLGAWTSAAVAADWQGYCEASQSMREHMLRTVAAEAELLRPLLSR